MQFQYRGEKTSLRKRRIHDVQEELRGWIKGEGLESCRRHQGKLKIRNYQKGNIDLGIGKLWNNKPRENIYMRKGERIGKSDRREGGKESRRFFLQEEASR